MHKKAKIGKVYLNHYGHGPLDKWQSNIFAILSDFIDQPYKNNFSTIRHVLKITRFQITCAFEITNVIEYRDQTDTFIA